MQKPEQPPVQVPKQQQVNFGDRVMKVVGDREIHGKFIGTHPIGPGYFPIMIKGRIIGKRFIAKHDAPFMQPDRERPHITSKYNPAEIARFRYHNMQANSEGMELVRA